MQVLQGQSLIITTLGRYQDLEITFDALLRCQAIPETFIIVVGDKKKRRDFQKLCNTFREDCSQVNLILRFTKPWRNKQLELALSLLKSDGLIHIIDDDLSPSSEYFTELDWHFSKFPDCVMAGGFLTPVHQSKVSFARRFFLLDAKRPGAYLISGQTSQFQHRQDVSEKSYTEVDWLSGCCMSFRGNLLGKISPDLKLEDESFDEDLDLSRQAAKYGKLHVVTGARCEHRISSEGRKKSGYLLKKKLVHRYYLLEKHRPGLIPRLAFLWSCIGIGLAIHSKRNPDSNLIIGFWSGIRGLGSI